MKRAMWDGDAADEGVARRCNFEGIRKGMDFGRSRTRGPLVGVYPCASRARFKGGGEIMRNGYARLGPAGILDASRSQ